MEAKVQATWLVIIIINIQGQMGNRPLQNVCKRGPVRNQVGGNYVTFALDIIFILFLQIPVTFRPFVFDKVLLVISYIIIHC